MCCQFFIHRVYVLGMVFLDYYNRFSFDDLTLLTEIYCVSEVQLKLYISTFSYVERDR
jgi:hypothetical protein